MANVVVVEPNRILQQAMALFLAEEHTIELRESVTAPELGNLHECDLLVIDGASLSARGMLPADLLGALRTLTAPILWLENDVSLERPEGAKVQVLKTPLEHKSLKEAVASLLEPAGRPRREAAPPQAANASAGSVPDGKAQNPTTVGEPPSSGFIDLVEVVTDESPDGDKESEK